RRIRRLVQFKTGARRARGRGVRGAVPPARARGEAAVGALGKHVTSARAALEARPSRSAGLHAARPGLPLLAPPGIAAADRPRPFGRSRSAEGSRAAQARAPDGLLGPPRRAGAAGRLSADRGADPRRVPARAWGRMSAPGGHGAP